MKKLVVWFAKKYAKNAVQNAVKAKGDAVAKTSRTIGVWLAKIRLVTAFLERLATRLADGELADGEVNASLDEIELLVQQVSIPAETVLANSSDAADGERPEPTAEEQENA